MSSNAAQTIPVVISGSTPSYKLFDANAVTVATLFGTPAAGSALMALNYQRMGKAGKGVLAVVLGFAITGLVILFAWHLPQSVTAPIALALLFGTQWSARALQGSAVKVHVQHGGQLASKWGAFSLGIACLGALVAIFYLANDKPSITIGTKDQVYYSGSATKAEAQSLGEALKTHGYFNDYGADVQLEKGSDGTVISFIVKAGSWDKPGVLSNFEEVGREVAPSVGGFPVRVQLMNKTYHVEKQSNVGKVDFGGNDDIYYLGDATQAQAQALGETFKSIGFFKGDGADVFLTKHSDGAVLAFVVNEAGWNDPANVANFESIVRKAAPAIGSLPVRLRLVDSSLDVKKDEMIN